jgi:hypothetical protein
MAPHLEVTSAASQTGSIMAFFDRVIVESGSFFAVIGISVLLGASAAWTQGRSTGPVCGNGVQEKREDCDAPDDASCPGLCQVDCSCGTELPQPNGYTAIIENSFTLPAQDTIHLTGSTFCADDSGNAETICEIGTFDATNTSLAATTAQEAIENLDRRHDGVFYPVNFDPGCATPTCGIQEAIDAASNVGGGVVALTAPHTFDKTTVPTINLPNDVSLIGRGASTLLTFTNLGTTTAISIQGDRVKLRDLHITTIGEASGGKVIACGESTNYHNQSDIEGVFIRGSTVRGLGDGIYWACLKSNIRDTEVTQYGVALRLIASFEANRPNAVAIYGSKFRASDWGIFIDPANSDLICRNVTILGSTIEGNTIGIEQAGRCNIVSIGNHFEQDQPLGQDVKLGSNGAYIGIANHYSAQGDPGTDIERTGGGSTIYDISIGENFGDGVTYPTAAETNGIRFFGTTYIPPGLSVANGRMFGANFSHPTDCTSIQPNKYHAFMGDLCWEQDDFDLYVANPNDGGVVDEATDWKRIIDSQ